MKREGTELRTVNYDLSLLEADRSSFAVHYLSFLRALTLVGLLLSGCAKPPTIRPIPPSPPTRRGITWVRVKVLGGVSELVFSSHEPFTIKMGRKSLHSLAEKEWRVSLNNTKLSIQTNAGTAIRKPYLPLTVSPKSNQGFITVNGKPYRGRIEIQQSRRGTLLAVNVLDIEDYLRGVVPLEIGHLDPSKMEAVKAQAVAARSYTLTHLKNNHRYDVEATVRHQVYGGRLAETPLTDLAVLETHGIVATYKGKPIDARYSSTCGGRTTSAEYVWGGGSLPYLVGKFDGRGSKLDRAYCQKAPRFQWTKRWKKSAFFQKIKRNLLSIVGRVEIGEVTDVKTTRWDPSGRVVTLEVKTTKGNYSIRKGKIRNLLRNSNGSILRSNFFELKIDGETVTMKGRGMGHGVGMCQWGAIGMAEQGFSYRQIIRHYYKGIS
ncbi:SpoIID/LytB domain-containing protein, partial [candidate division TA06 bacterium]|nr:SpoIID/LytB domain-containing protein [candidate division TA06 bacterium]